MDFENERYIRLYTTDTVNRLLLPWQSRHLLDSLWRKFDRAGVIEIGRHDVVRAIAALLGDPQEWVAEALAPLVDGEDPPLELRELDGRKYLVAPNFMAGQEAKQSDKARQKAAREKRRAIARLEQLVTTRDESVTDCDATVTRRDETVTPSHTESHAVTSGHSVPSLAVPSNAKPSSGGASLGSALADAAFAELRAHPVLAIVATEDMAQALAMVAVNHRRTPSQVRAAIAAVAGKVSTGKAAGEPVEAANVASRLEGMVRNWRDDRQEDRPSPKRPRTPLERHDGELPPPRSATGAA